MNIILLSYNNYFNRIVKKEQTLEDYLKYQVGDTILEVNFNPSDGLDTELIINYDNTDCNYLLEVDDLNNIVSRWFVVESDRLRNGQYKLLLKRDIMVDYYDSIMSAPVYVEKGYVNKTNPIIFSREGEGFNEIKMEEKPLYDVTNCPWIVGYCGAKYPTEDTEVVIDNPQETVPDISNFPFKVGQTVNGPLNLNTSKIVFTVDAQNTFYFMNHALNNFDSRPTELDDVQATPYVELVTGYNSKLNVAETIEEVTNILNDEGLNINYSEFNNFHNNVSQSEVTSLLSFNGQVFKDKEKYVRIKVVKNSVRDDRRLDKYNDPSLYQAITEQLKYIASKLPSFKNASVNEINVDYEECGYGARLEYATYKVTTETVNNPNNKVTTKFSKTSNTLKDAPYKMFCFPVDGTIKINEETFTMDKDFSLNVAKGIINTLQPANGTAGGNLYDIQLLPYCPIKDWFVSDANVNTLKSTETKENFNFNYIKSGAGTNLGAIFYCTKSSFTGNILSTIDITTDGYDFKVDRETSKYRLCSPNYANFEDFDPYMNKGVKYINYDCTYKPFTPYIKLNISFDGLYGRDFNDSRGLILGGDYSIPMMSDAFTTYEIQNKNYSNIFDRETQHLEVMHKWDTARNVTKAITGTVAGAAGGGAAGSMMGIMPGIGAAVGAGLSAVGGALDVAYGEASYNQSMDMRRDMFQFNIQNIQAKPQGLVKTSAFNYNTRLVPFIERYSATEVEKTLFRNKLKYNGMTINAIGTLREYKKANELTFVKGQLIRLEGIDEDAHLVSAIYEQIGKGVYL